MELIGALQLLEVENFFARNWIVPIDSMGGKFFAHEIKFIPRRVHSVFLLGWKCQIDSRCFATPTARFLSQTY